MKNNRFIKTVTVGIPAHNEEKNIEGLLESILSQKGDNFRLERIIVICDGCTDKTEQIISELGTRYKIIEVINDGLRLGKNARLNQFYGNLKSEIFISFDADIKIIDTNIIEKIIGAFKDRNTGLVGGRVLHAGTTFIGNLISVYEDFWLNVIDSINSGENVHGHTGPISAGSKEFLKNVKIPDGLPDDHYLYFESIRMGFLYSYAKDARVFVKTPGTFNDYMGQQTRFINSAGDLKKYFGSWINEYYNIPYQTKLKGYLKTFVKYPLELPLAGVLAILQKMFSSRYSANNKKGLWVQIQSSK